MLMISQKELLLKKKNRGIHHTQQQRILHTHSLSINQLSLPLGELFERDFLKKQREKL